MADLPDNVMANLLETPGADETILTRWSHCALTASPAATLGRGLAGDIPTPEVNARTVLRMGDGQPADYLVTGHLGEGGMGIVFEAEQVRFKRRVALKMIKPALASDPSAAKAFFREAVITSRLDHPGIIPVLDFGVSQDGRALYAMMKASGVAWHRVIRDQTLSENLAVFDRVADIVAYSHRHGILHRDIKPANVLLGNHGEVWLGDWGVAVARQPDGAYSHAGPAGTPQYMAPEMARCDAARIGLASDIYLLGAVLFEIVTGRPPHGGDNVGTALLNSARNTIHTTDRTNGLLPLAYKAMAALPEHRYATVDELREAVTKRLRLNESVYRQQQADTHLSAARKTGDYELFQQAIAGYNEAMALSSDNDAARRNRDEAIVEYARRALANGETDLAESIAAQIPDGHEKAADLAAVIAAEKDAQAKRSRRQKIQRSALLVMAVMLLVGAAAYFWRSSEIKQAVESGKRFDRTENDARRRGAIMSLQFSLPPDGLTYLVAKLDVLSFGSSDDAKRRISAQRENRDRVMDELTEMLAPVSKACESINAIQRDEDVTAIYQILHMLKPGLREKLEEVSAMRKNGELEESQADAILKGLEYLTTRPERYEYAAQQIKESSKSID